ncbi:hypothetical protein HZB88_04710, partial [archaeon]|nr:hypothetical protein [archaeon]
MLSKLIGFGREKFIMLSLIFLLNFCSGYSKITPAGERDNDSTKITIKNEQKRYAILFEPVDNSKGFYLKDKDGNVLWDEGDKNASLIHLARMYDS